MTVFIVKQTQLPVIIFSLSLHKKVINFFVLLLMFVCPLSAFSAPIEKEKSLVFSQNRVVSQDDCAFKNLTEAYALIGYKIAFNIVPTKRALQLSNSGKHDGETARISGIDSAYKNLIQIPVAICYTKLSLFARKGENISSEDELSVLAIGALRGNLLAESLFSKFNLVTLLDDRHLIPLLLKNRLDIIVLPEELLIKYASPQQLKQIIKVEIDTAEVPLFHYLHISQKKVAPKITSALKKLEHSGFIANSIENHKP